jgi:hypothetical protein
MTMSKAQNVYDPIVLSPVHMIPGQTIVVADQIPARGGLIPKSSDHVPALLTSEYLIPRRALLSLSANLLKLNSQGKTETPTNMDPAYETPHQLRERFQRKLAEDQHRPPASISFSSQAAQSNLGILGAALHSALHTPEPPMNEDRPYSLRPNSMNGLPAYWKTESIANLSGAAWFVQQQVQSRIIQERARIAKRISYDPLTDMVTTPDGVVMDHAAFWLQHSRVDAFDSQITWIDRKGNPCSFITYVHDLCWLHNCDPKEFPFLDGSKMFDDDREARNRNPHPTEHITKKMGWFAACFITLGVILAIVAVAYLK